MKSVAVTMLRIFAFVVSHSTSGIAGGRGHSTAATYGRQYVCNLPLTRAAFSKRRFLNSREVFFGGDPTNFDGVAIFGWDAPRPFDHLFLRRSLYNPIATQHFFRVD